MKRGKSMYRKDNSKNSILKKYIASYIAILIIPLLIVNIVIFSINIGKFKNEIIEKNHVGMENIKNVFDIKTDELMNLALQAFSNVKLMNVSSSNFVDTMVEFKKELNNHVGTNGYVFEMALYVPEIDYVFTSLGASSFDKYSSLLYSFEGMSAEEFKNHLSGGEKIISMPVSVRNNPSEAYRAYIVKENDLPSSRYIILLLDNYYIKSVINGFDDDLLIFDSENQLITDNDRRHPLSYEVIAGYLENEIIPMKTVTFENDDYCISTIESQTNGYTYVSVIREKDLFTQIIYLQWINILVIIIILIIGVLIISYSMKSFYSPVKKLTSILQGYADDGNKNSNEFENAQQGIDNLIKNQKVLEDKVEKAYEITRDYMLFKLINASLTNIEDAKKQFEFYGIHFNLPYYYIALFHIEDIEVYNTSDVLKIFRAYVQDNDCIVTDFFENNKICVILPSLQKHHDEDNRKLIASMKEFLTEITLCPITVCVGNPADDISNLWHSYIEACSAYDYKLVKGKYGSLFFCDTFFNNHSNYSRRKIDILSTYIKAGEKEKAFEIIDDIANEVSNRELSLHTVKCMCFDLTSTVMNATIEMFGDADNDELYMKGFDISSLVEFESIEQLIVNVKTFLVDVLNKKSDTRAEEISGDTMLGKIKQYITENFNKPYICVENIAEHFKISTTYLGQFFKGKTGYTISEYITQVQLDNTKKLLVETDMSIKEIADRMGYTNVSNFIRKFKAKTGVTPGIFRKANRSDYAGGNDNE